MIGRGEFSSMHDSKPSASWFEYANTTRIYLVADDQERQAFVDSYIVLEFVESFVAITCFVGEIQHSVRVTITTSFLDWVQ